jgi:XisI protein
MERISQYRQAIRQLLADRASIDRSNSQPDIESQLIFDTEHDSPVGDATRTIPIIRCWLGRTQAHLQLFYPEFTLDSNLG